MKMLNDLKLNESAYISKVVAFPDIKRRLMDVGFVKGVLVKPVLINLNNEMTAYRIKGTLIAVRRDDTKNIEVL